MEELNLLGNRVPKCSGCGEPLDGAPYVSEGDPFCTRECSDAFDIRVYLLYGRR